MINILLSIGGLALILFGANWMTDGAAAVAKRFKISDLVIGLTIVAFGTSAPELVISVISSLNGSAEMAIGNVVGSNLFNILMIIGITAIVSPITVGKGTMTKEIPLVILSCIALIILTNDTLLGSGMDSVSRADGLILLCFFMIFMRYTFAIAKSTDASTEDEEEAIKDMALWKSLLFIIAGLTALIFGGQFFVDGASGIARAMGINESVIGLTLVAGGTSLPELATSIVAARKNKAEMAIGNVIGSNLFNTFFVLGCAATVAPLPLGNIGNIDLFTLLGASLLFWITGWFFRNKTITRIEGLIMAACYVAYITYLISLL